MKKVIIIMFMLFGMVEFSNCDVLLNSDTSTNNASVFGNKASQVSHSDTTVNQHYIIHVLICQ